MTPAPLPATQAGLFLLLRRMRMPLAMLILTYAVAVMGLVLIPGEDLQGRVWHMGFFHAFYFVSFMGSTIGFGEIPYPFTEAQRMWTVITIYITVFAWLYAIGSLLAVVQDPAFRRMLTLNRFTRTVRRLRDPFYLVAGYGDTGSLLVRELADRGLRSVVLDIAQDRIDALEVEDHGHGLQLAGLCADAADPATLTAAGLTRPNCLGIIALTQSDQVNLKVAVTSKLLSPTLPVICRAESHDTQANMVSFGTDHVINAYDSFADRFAMAIHSPSMHVIFEWLTSTYHAPLSEPLLPPRGMWVLCGFGRFGKAVSRYLAFEGVETTIVEADPQKTAAPEDVVVGRGTEAVTLREAHVEKAVGIIAGTDNDANNLSIVVTARALNPRLFTVARQNHRRNDAVFNVARLNLVMQPSTIIARKIMALIRTPLLADFLHLARHKDNRWANVLVSRILGVAGNDSPDTWVITVNERETPAVMAMLEERKEVRLAQLMSDPRQRAHRLPCLPLLLKRDRSKTLLPEETLALEPGDELLFCGHPQAVPQMEWAVRNYNVLDYIRTGRERPSGFIWGWLAGENR